MTDTLREVPDSDIIDNYKGLLKKIEIYTKDKAVGSSVQIIKDFLSTEKKLYDGVELSIQGILCATVKVSVESVVESLVSRYEGPL